MGAKEGMDCQREQITLYTAQTGEVIRLLAEHGVYYAKMKYIARKYAEVSNVFLQAYSWYAENAGYIVPKPTQAESAIWTFCEIKYVDCYPGSQILKLNIQTKDAVFFRMTDWNKVLNLRYIGESEAEESEFAQRLSRSGVPNEYDAFFTPFYPQFKKEIQKSWNRLFRYDKQIKDTDSIPYQDMQAGLWRLNQESIG